MDRETGFDCEFVDDPPKELHTECSVCLSVLRQPYLVDCCGNHFCKACLERVSQEKRECPLCKDKDFKAILDKGLERVLNQTAVYCSNKESGCDWSGELRELDSHLNATSPYMDGPDKEPNVQSRCQFVDVRCQYCPVTVRRYQMTEHLNECPNKPILCTHCKKHTASHQDMTNFHYPVCPKYPVKCPNKCGAKLQRKNVAKHVDTTCPLIKIPCKYAHVGCMVVTNRKQMDNHMKTATASHLSLMDKAYSELQENTDGSGTEVEQLRSQIQGLKLSHSHDMETLQECHRAQIHRLCSQISDLQEKLESASVRSVSKSSFPARSKSEAKLSKPATYYGASVLDYPDSKAPYSYKPSKVGSASGWKDYSSYDSCRSVAVAQPPKKKDSGSGWLTALGAGLGVALGVGVAGAAVLASRSSSSKKDDEDDWDDDDW